VRITTMPYDPNLPANNSPLSSAVMRGQLTGLKSLIDALQNITAAQVDGVTTLNPGEAATASLSIIGNTLHLSLAIPRGDEGGQGVPGVQGPPFANAVADPVTTLAAGTPATVDINLSGTDVHFAFGIPTGPQGAPGIDGAPGEVTNAALAMSISGTSSNSNAVPTLDTPFSNDPASLADMETMRAAHNALVLALRR
jgi:hypothetical protein